MYQVENADYPSLDTYLCYECGFSANTTMMEQKSLYQAYQNLFMHSNGWLVPKKLPPTKPEQPEKTTSDRTESRN